MRLIVVIVVNSLLLYGVVRYFPEFGFAINVPNVFVGYAIAWAIFWFFFAIIKKLIQIIALPLAFFTMGLSSIFVNVFVFYLFAYVVNEYVADTYTMSVQLGTIWQTFVLSVILSITMSVVHFIVKKIV